MEQPSVSPSSPAGVVAGACAQVAGLDETLWAARSAGELVEVVVELEALRCRTAAIEASVLAEVEARKMARTQLGWASTADWFTHLAATHRGGGHRVVRQAPALLDLARTHHALGAGRVSPEQAGVIVDAIERLPHRDELRQRAEGFLLEQATRLDATDLAKAARHLWEVVDPDRAERDAQKDLEREDRAAHLGRFLSITEDGAGGVRLRGRGTVEDAATLKAALLPLTRPAPALDPATCTDVSDPRDHGARLWDALVQACAHTLSTDLAPDAHGARPRLTVTTTLETLQDRLDWATLGGWTDEGLQLTPGAVRRLACDADVSPVTLGTRSEVLDVGRTQRLVTPAIWRALVCRDRHCTFPDCTRPPVMCHAHHIRHWADHGPTELANLVLLCGHHHRLLHHTPWQVRLNPHDHHPEFLPPPRPGHPTHWLRHRPRRE